eukprot:scaffold682_cov363-Pavlova_lutheri.AAC.45
MKGLTKSPLRRPFRDELEQSTRTSATIAGSHAPRRRLVGHVGRKYVGTQASCARLEETRRTWTWTRSARGKREGPLPREDDKEATGPKRWCCIPFHEKGGKRRT